MLRTGGRRPLSSPTPAPMGCRGPGPGVHLPHQRRREPPAASAPSPATSRPRSSAATPPATTVPPGRGARRDPDPPRARPPRRWPPLVRPPHGGTSSWRTCGGSHPPAAHVCAAASSRRPGVTQVREAGGRTLVLDSVYKPLDNGVNNPYIRSHAADGRERGTRSRPRPALPPQTATTELGRAIAARPGPFLPRRGTTSSSGIPGLGCNGT